MSDKYKEKLKAFCEGLEIRNIEKFIENSPEDLNLVGKEIAKRTKELAKAELLSSFLDQEDFPDDIGGLLDDNFFDLL